MLPRNYNLPTLSHWWFRQMLAQSHDLRKCCFGISVLLLAFGQQQVAWTAEESESERSKYAVETEVFTGNEEEPVVRTQTFFFAGRAYDMVLGKKTQIARFDFDSKTVALLDRKRENQTAISFDDILQFQAQLGARAIERKGLAGFLAKPTFIREFDASNSTVKLSSPWLTYEAHGRPSNSEDVEQFVAFADWSARLASLLNPAAPPAEARLELNRVLSKRGWHVQRVKRSGGPRARTLGDVRSEHTYRELAESDVVVIQAIEKDLKDFRRLPFSDYRQQQSNTGQVAAKN